MKALKRNPRSGMLTGVIAGFSDYFAIDVTVLRILFVLFVLITGLFPGVVGYAVAAIIMPVGSPVIHEHKNETPPQQG